MTARTPERAPDAAAYRKALAAAALPTLAVPVVLGLIIAGLGFELEPIALAAGAVGWIVALVLRAPVAIGALRSTGDRTRAQPIITGASGPLEELVRLGVLLLVGRELDTALSIGLGWAAIEVVYSLVNGIALLTLIGRDDPEAEQARAMLPMREVLEPSGVWWGIVERVWASALHIGFTAIVARAPLLVLGTIVVHSAVNLTLLRAGERLSLPRLQLLGAIVASVVVAVAVVLWR